MGEVCSVQVIQTEALEAADARRWSVTARRTRSRWGSRVRSIAHDPRSRIGEVLVRLRIRNRLVGTRDTWGPPPGLLPGLGLLALAVFDPLSRLCRSRPSLCLRLGLHSGLGLPNLLESALASASSSGSWSSRLPLAYWTSWASSTRRTLRQQPLDLLHQAFPASSMRW